MKNITLAMVAIIAAVAMLSAGLAVPMQQASASALENRRDGGDGGGNNFEFKNKQDCAIALCRQSIDVDNTQTITED
jgi:hypothetical protein